MRNTHTIGSGIWQETVKIVKNKKYTLYDLECGKKTDQQGKWQTLIAGHRICRENRKCGKWQMNTVGPEYVEKTENHGKWEPHTV